MTTQVRSVTLRYSHTIGRSEQGGRGFRVPVAMVRGDEDVIYVVNRADEYRPEAVRVTICTVGEEYLGEFAKGGILIGEVDAPDDAFIWPTSIALDKEGNVYVADEWLNRISIFTGDGERMGRWGTPGEDDGQLNGPSGLAFDSDDTLYVVDSRNNRIQSFTKDGKFLLQWGRQGTGDGEFNLPWGIDVDKNGFVYVADWRNERIQKFSPDGRFLMKFGSPGTGDGEFNRPAGVAVDKEGIIYVADRGNDRLQVFDSNGRFLTKMTGDATISNWGKEKLDANADSWKQREIAHGLEREKLLWGPVAVEVDDQNRIFVVDTLRDRIQVYLKLAPTFAGLYDEARL
jgi:tripartite motif-containing protein 71